jgi:hypothetical protein
MSATSSENLHLARNCRLPALVRGQDVGLSNSRFLSLAATGGFIFVETDAAEFSVGET